ncbi:Phytocyanin domain containing protein [Parasponia andersonii]|uniref:Phytocyanin domain containing protein n=1 Tax=Parasponia andersonii TaxID=3476 RepID=A0A2P5AZD9_PARAD|nr:Phytocyanin domain containing protein [Parasponia andersonii]
MALFTTVITYLLIVLLLLITLSEAREILVGGEENSWTIPSSSSETLNKWAQKTRFKVGDVLVWHYQPGNDTVLEVTNEDYVTCISMDPIREYHDGNTKIKLERSGAYYFITGAYDHCQKGLKLNVVVMSSNVHHHNHGHGISTAPSPALPPQTSNVAPHHKPKLINFGMSIAFGIIGSLVAKYMLMI